MNRLAQESSPYLLQHATNPVDWWPWCDEAFELAQRQERPILLSIGYSSCHWCHVMAHESFADAAIAEQMNRHFVCIKVDREEHPDLDQIYQTAHQLLTHQGGGWPLTIFLTPEAAPFYSGTYFPPLARAGLPAFPDVLQHVTDAWQHRRPAILARTPDVLASLQQALQPVAKPPGKLERRPVRHSIGRLLEQFDPRHGGFGAAPKFPHPTELQLLLYVATLQDDDNARHAALHSLRKMAEGGVYDQLGGGFFRYSVDERWEIPHFEKMLTDNALLLWLYSEAFSLSGEELFRRTVSSLIDWAGRELRTPEGLFYSALDADSGGTEGAFYLWDKNEISRLIDGERLALTSAHFGLDNRPNHDGRHWHLHVWRPLEEVAGTLAIPPATARQHIDAACARLLAQRDTRPHPGCDDKLLCGANALMIRALVRAASVFERPEWLAGAQHAMHALRARFEIDGRLHAVSQHDQARLDAGLDDHAWLLEASLELLQADFSLDELQHARWLADQILEHFEDRERGGFFVTRHDHAPLIARARTGHDHATPSGNGVAARSLIRLGHLVSEPRYLHAAEQCLQAFRGDFDQHVGPSLLLALEEWLAPPTLVILRGVSAGLRAWQTRLRMRCEPQLMVLCIPVGMSGLPICLDKPASADITAWVCRGGTCLPPVASYDELLTLLRPEPDYMVPVLMPEQ
ncbi:thioredoxin domain-containing protein [Uliginosibacterium sp. 31-16]|uniref:thioredoxin domain-containing protein n=1 Tax=Uliginosibacterium sp. 31-16 TaxID=3068315 RepID=UPI00273EC537|nr:thioredoxin domain-containing protein [Uliginosibacterium sp. 31-16]MDP5238951.1 thioredoxin domain-containing protein [Uliginosibacterium sp. 31-16]